MKLDKDQQYPMELASAIERAIYESPNLDREEIQAVLDFTETWKTHDEPSKELLAAVVKYLKYWADANAPN